MKIQLVKFFTAFLLVLFLLGCNQQNVSELQRPEIIDDSPPANIEADEPVSPVECEENNKVVGDGQFAVCKGNNIIHEPSSITATLIGLDDSKMILSISGLPGGNSLFLEVYGTTEVGGIAYQYLGALSDTIANIKISTKSILPRNNVQDQVDEQIPPPIIEEDEPVLPTINESSSPIISDKPKKFLTLIMVHSAPEGRGYDSNSWEPLTGPRDNNDVQIYDVAIWDNLNPGNPRRISVYKFDQSFDPSKEEYRDGGQAWVEHRERYNFLTIDDLPPVPASKEYLEAFKVIVRAIIEDQPAEHYGLSYTGHGGGDGNIFGYKIFPDDAPELLSYTTSLIGKKLDFLDWGFACAMGTYRVISSQYNYADYILASDISRQGYLAGDQHGNYQALKPWSRFGDFFSPSKTIEQSLLEIIDVERQVWEISSIREDMISKSLKQSLCLYDTSEYEILRDAVNLDAGMQSENDYLDVLDYIEENYPDQRQKFFDFVHCVDNKDFFTWNLDYSGLRKLD